MSYSETELQTYFPYLNNESIGKSEKLLPWNKKKANAKNTHQNSPEGKKLKINIIKVASKIYYYHRANFYKSNSENKWRHFKNIQLDVFEIVYNAQ